MFNPTQSLFSYINNQRTVDIAVFVTTCTFFATNERMLNDDNFVLEKFMDVLRFCIH